MESWTTRKLLTWTTQHFEDKGIDSPRVAAEMLLGHVLGVDRLRLYMEPDREATEAERQTFRGLVARAGRHEPVDYLIGRAPFFSLTFRVGPAVLIPRPSSETLVEHLLQRHPPTPPSPPTASTASDRAISESEVDADCGVDSAVGRGGGSAEPVISIDTPTAGLSSYQPTATEAAEQEAQGEADVDDRPTPTAPPDRYPANRMPPKRAATRVDPTAGRRMGYAAPVREFAGTIADVCTGSGVLAITLAKHLPRARFVATDLSEAALEVARQNAADHGVADRIDFRLGDLYGPLRGQRFDYLLANPPYISDAEWADVLPNVKDYEPTTALRSGRDGLDHLRPLIAHAADHLAPGGQVLLEMSSTQGDAVLELATAAGLTDPQILDDHERLPRVLVAGHGG